MVQTLQTRWHDVRQSQPKCCALAPGHTVIGSNQMGALRTCLAVNAITLHEAGALLAALYAHLEPHKRGLIVALPDSLICSTGRLLLGAFHHLRGCCADSAGLSPGWSLTLLTNQRTPCRVY